MKDNLFELVKKYKIIVLVIVLILIVIVALILGRGNSVKKDYKDIVWSNLKLGNLIPEPPKTYGEIGVDLDTALSVTLIEVTNDEFQEYKNKCIDAKYTIESEEDKTSYIAFNENGYELRLVYSDEELYIHLDAPEKFSEIEWPTNGLGTKLPIPKSKIGRIAWNNEESFIVHLGETSIDELNNYIKECKNYGFNLLLGESEGFYNANNDEKYELTLRYLGFNNIEISLKAPEKNSNDEKDDNTNKDDNSQNNENEDKTDENDTQQGENKKPSVTYSTNDKDTVKNGNSGIYAYRDRGGQYYNYYIIDFDEGYVYFFSDGNGDSTCDRIKIVSGDLNNGLTITYHDGSSTWDEVLHFKWKRQPDHLILLDHNYSEFDFYSTNLENALNIKNTRTIHNY